jgi:hypothetical protein
LAIFARFNLRISSSVLPENIEPQITSIHPRRILLIFGSINIRLEKLLYFYGLIFDIVPLNNKYGTIAGTYRQIKGTI